MKLPDIGLGPNHTKEEIYEAIVRDCAEVCESYTGAFKSEEFAAKAVRGAIRQVAQMILTRYGLEPK